jgi:hypothetical protein
VQQWPLRTRTFGKLPDSPLVFGLAVTVVALSVSACALDEPYQRRSMRSDWRAFNAEENSIGERNTVEVSPQTWGFPPRREQWRPGDWERWHYLRGQMLGLEHKSGELDCDTFLRDEEAD